MMSIFLINFGWRLTWTLYIDSQDHDIHDKVSVNIMLQLLVHIAYQL